MRAPSLIVSSPSKEKKLNSVPNNKILDWSELKAFEDNKVNLIEKLKDVLGRVETLWEKEKMLVTSIFSFSAMFSKEFFLRVCVVKS